MELDQIRVGEKGLTAVSEKTLKEKPEEKPMPLDADMSVSCCDWASIKSTEELTVRQIRVNSPTVLRRKERVAVNIKPM